jgi:hypothetical protein
LRKTVPKKNTRIVLASRPKGIPVPIGDVMVGYFGKLIVQVAEDET